MMICSLLLHMDEIRDPEAAMAHYTEHRGTTGAKYPTYERERMLLCFCKCFVLQPI